MWILRVLAVSLFHPAHVNLFSDETYRGDARGFEITSIDILVGALFVGARLRRAASPSRAFVIPRIAYALAVLLSAVASPDMLRSSYGVWKLARMYFAFAVLATELVELPMVLAAVQGLAVGVLLEGGIALHQRYVEHVVRVTGSQPHPNSLAMLVNLIAPIAFALFLAGHGRWLAASVFIVAGVCDILTLSRGGMLMFLLGTALVAIVSLARKPTWRKATILTGLAGAGGLVLAWSARTILMRFETAPAESVHARELFVAAAKRMTADHPLGVGINMYSQVLANAEYSAVLGIDPMDRNGIAHNIYWLTAAETGYVGVAAFAFLLGAVYLAALRATLRNGVRGEVALGILVGLTLTYIQGTAEWIFRQSTMSYAFWLVAAIVVGLTHSSRVTNRSA
jgi:O-antigen ligase